MNTTNCLSDKSPLEDFPIANAYVPFQKITKIFPMMEGLQNGTIFCNFDVCYEKPDKNYRPKINC